MKAAATIVLCATLTALAVPATASVKDGVDLWQSGDYDRAIAEWKAPAAGGDADAQFNLAQAYKLGRGVPADLRTAEGWYRKAAVQGHENAQATLGLIMFQNGDRTGAMPWLKQAADRGEARAQYVYGTALFNGDLVARDWPRAYAMMTRAAASGLPQAATSLQQMDQFVPLAERKQGVEIAKTISRGPASAPPPVMAQASARPEPAPVRVAAALPQPVAKTDAPVPAPRSIERPAPKPAPARAQIAAPRPVRSEHANGPWRVQLGAFGAASGAQSAWASLTSKSPALRGLKPFYVKAGPVTRLQAGGLADRAAADRACGAAKAAGAGCFTVAP